MKTVLVLFFLLVTPLAFGQAVPNQVVFKVRKKPSQTILIKEKKSESTLIMVEEPATFQGGDLIKFNSWVAQNIKYPQMSVEGSITGKVYIQFAVNEKGKVEDVKVLRGMDPTLDAEAVRVISSSPLWTPPRQGGRPVKQLFTLPISIRPQE